jgi:hypothetical protein
VQIQRCRYSRLRPKQTPRAVARTSLPSPPPCPDSDSKTSSRPSSRPHRGCSLRSKPGARGFSGDDAGEYCSGPPCSKPWRDPPKPRRQAERREAQPPAGTGTRRKLGGGLGSIGSQESLGLESIISPNRRLGAAKMSPACKFPQCWFDISATELRIRAIRRNKRIARP